jgi:carbamoyltransferase
MRVLGIHDGHNASVCLIENGRIKFAIQEERLVNQKNKSGFPNKALQKTLDYCGISINDVDKVALASTHNSAEFATGEYFKKHKKSSTRRAVEGVGMKTPLYSIYKKRRRQERLQPLLDLGINSDAIYFVEHHLAHAATAYYGSNFPRNEKILVLTNDGAGDGLCATVSLGQNGELQRIAEVDSSHSLAGIYCLTTKMLGFKPLEHEYKLMGMAPYCSEYGTKLGYEVFKDIVKTVPPFHFERTTTEPISQVMPLLLKRSKFVRFDSICAGLQKFTEETLVEWVKNCMKETGTSKIALAGGIFMNVKANQKVMELPEVEDIFIFPSCGDETVSIGAAFHVFQKYSEEEIHPLDHFYLGDTFSDDDALKSINEFMGSFEFSFKKVENIEKEVGKLIAENHVVARCKGRMEFGARALGNRSILANPANLDCVRKINMMVKKRDFWMPFAPVMKKDRAHEYVQNPKNVDAPYMILTFNTTDKFQELIAAVQQADLTARPQMITKEMNNRYYAILEEFENLTGRGVLLNTSFNLHGLPIVHGPKEAIEVFRDSGLNYLALGNYLLEK